MNFALLAPVPPELLVAACDALLRCDRVAIGSHRVELFRQVERDRRSTELSVLIYPAWEDAEAGPRVEVGWLGSYAGVYEVAVGGSGESAPRFPTDGAWEIYWLVRDLLPLKRRVAIRDLAIYRAGRDRRRLPPPRGPEIIERPEWL